MFFFDNLFFLLLEIVIGYTGIFFLLKCLAIGLTPSNILYFFLLFIGEKFLISLLLKSSLVFKGFILKFFVVICLIFSDAISLDSTNFISIPELILNKS